MTLITKTKHWADNEGVNYDDMNANFDSAYNLVNGNIDNDNIDPSAGIVESKLAFSTSSGHNHDGVNSKAIPKGLLWQVNGTLATGSNQGKKIPFLGTQVITKAYAFVDTAPVGADLIIDIDYSTDDGATWTSIWNTNQSNRLTVGDGDLSATQTSFDTTSFTEGDLLRVNIDQIGSTTAGANLTIVVK